MSALLIEHGLVVTVDSENHTFRDGSVYIEDNIIKEIGPTADIGPKEGAEVIDASGKVVTRLTTPATAAAITSAFWNSLSGEMLSRGMTRAAVKATATAPVANRMSRIRRGATFAGCC